jgi:hypothetical protein
VPLGAASGMSGATWKPSRLRRVSPLTYAVISIPFGKVMSFPRMTGMTTPAVELEPLPSPPERKTA